MHGVQIAITVACTIAVLGTGCGPDVSGEPSDEGDRAHAPSDGVGVLSSMTPGGVRITLSVAPDPPRPGTVRLHLEIPSGAAPTDSISVDVLAPRMPAHGIVRYPVESEGEGLAVAEIQIPMEGLWAVYVNLDRGSEAAAFELEVKGDEGTAGAQHHEHH